MIENPKWHRTRLSIEICRLWNWIDATGRTCFTIYIAIDIRAALHHPTADRHNGAHLNSKAVHARSNESARYRCHSKSSAPELAVQLVGGAHPTRLRMAPLWLAHEVQSGWASPTQSIKMSKLQWNAPLVHSRNKALI